MTAASSAGAREFVAVPLRDVERELSRQFQADQDEDGPPIQWARMSNLIVFADTPEAAEAVSAEVPAIIEVHPARVLLLQALGGEGPGRVEAAVRVATHYGQGRQEIASEEIRLTASGQAVERLAFLVRGLRIGDLPTNLWWASRLPPPLAGTFLFELAKRANQVIYDSFAWAQPAQGLRATAGWLDTFERGPGPGGGTSRYRVASDLSWRRLKAWRRLLGQALDPIVAPGTLDTIREVQVEHGPHSVMIALSLVSWLGQALGWSIAGAKVQLSVQADCQVQSPKGPVRLLIRRLADAPTGLRSLRIACTIADEPATLVVTPEAGDRRLSVIIEKSATAPRTVAITHRSTAELVAEQLSDRERDPVFRKTMAFAHTLAQKLLGL